jgi:O-antigen ligase
LILGFFALAGWQTFKNHWRWIFIVAPFAILATIYFASARGALVAFPVCLLVALFMLVRNKLAAVGLCAVLVVGGVLVSTSSLTAWNGRMEALPGIVASLISGEELSDRSAQYRLELYRAGLRSFLDSPIFGHGWERLTSDPAQYLPEKYKFLQRLPHLHNEALDFLVAAGLLGLLVYIGLLALPIMACVRTPRDGLYPTRFYAAIMLSVTYFMLGLPDSMLAFEMHTMLFVAFTVIIIAYVREKPSAIDITSAP